MTYSLGLDLGTTYTAAAVCRNGLCEISPLGNRSAVIPSVIHLGADGTTLTGEAAQRRLTIDPSRVAREFKRRIGDPTPLLVGGSPIAAEALTARLAKAVVALVSEREGAVPERITVTHPAAWGPFKLDLLSQAMRMADLSSVSFLSEPEAAAWEYAATRPVAPGTTIAVYDLGGGTFDATVLQASADGFAVLGEPEGIERFGGIDIDQAVFSFVVAALDGAVEALEPDDPLTLSGLARLRADCVEAKEALSSDHEASIPVLLPTVRTEVRITRTELEGLIRPVMGDTVAAMRRALQSAGVSTSDLSAVLLVGGSSRIPLVGEVVSESLDRPVVVDAHPKYLVAMGAARFAAANGRLGSVVPVHAAPGVHTDAMPTEVPAAQPVVPPTAAAAAVATPPPSTAPTASGVPVTGDPAAPGAAPASGAGAAPHAARRSRLLAGVAVAVLAVLAAVGAIALRSGGDDDTSAGAADTTAEAAITTTATPADTALSSEAKCPTEGPFICITEVYPSASGGVAVTFWSIGVTPGSFGSTLVFFLANSPSANHDIDVVNSGKPKTWTSTDIFEGWSSEELSEYSVVCGGVINSGAFVQGSGDCLDLPDVVSVPISVE
jgi:molecular chaperone DnaK